MSTCNDSTCVALLAMGETALGIVAERNRQRTLRLRDGAGRAILVPVPDDLNLGDVVGISIEVPADEPVHQMLATPAEIEQHDLGDGQHDPPTYGQAAGAARRVVETDDPALRVPPHSIESERAVLGAVLLDNGVWPDVNHLAASDFYRSDHRRIYAAIAEMLEEGSLVDVVTVAVRLDDNPEVGGLEALQSFTEDTANPANAGAYAAKLLDLARLRALIKVGVETGDSAFSDNASSADVEADLRAKLDLLPLSHSNAATVLPVTRLDLWLADDEGPVEWLVDNLLPAGGHSMLGGGKAVGKSTLVRSLAAAVADGTQWLGRAVLPGTVVYIGREDGRKTTKAHFRKMGLRHPDRVFAMSISEKVPDGDRVLLFENTVRAHKPALVILDTVARYVKVRDGNDYNMTANAMERYVEVARTAGAHFLATHHNRKSGGDADDGVELNGSIGWQSHADTIMSISRSKDDRVVYAFGRDDAAMEKTIVILDDAGHVQSGGTKRSAADDDVLHEALNLIRRSTSPVSATDLRHELKRSKAIIGRAVKHLLADGDITPIGSGPTLKYVAVS